MLCNDLLLAFVSWCLPVSNSSYSCVCLLVQRNISSLNFDKLTKQRNKSGRSMSFVSEASAMEVVNSLGLQWVDGSKPYPF